ncbi:hypothetical protein NC653_038714 [Populus alba x Populus x berolinensis]|uniref:Uncharacterized protein n=1 Tax=Populus alba x Populus x berolinensis TaxID=444605 RepID=A0AAD6PTK5_9ROSI|nr:hypothetical protein NC653_038714 [Populus alba x Populus x berolinensis]
MSHSSLHCKLREILMGNKLFLVLGDFWNDDPEQSKFLITPLMGGAKQNEGLGNYFRQGSRDRKPTARVLNSKVSSVKERTPYDSPAFDLRRRPQGRAVTSDHQPICFPYSRFLILGISLSEVRDTVAVLNAQKSISKVTICSFHFNCLIMVFFSVDN